MSLIDITKPVSGNPTTQSVRDNFAAAAAEIDALDSAVTTLQGSVSGFDSHLTDTNNPHAVTKTQIGLGNVDNTSDVNKPISTATQAALDAKQNTLANSDGLIEGTTNLYFTPARVLVTVIAGLSTATNAVITASDTILSALGKLQKQISDNLTTLISHTGNTSNPHSVTKTQVGLGNVDNTSDLNKPISTATQAALNGKQNTLTNSDGLSEGTTNLYFAGARVLSTLLAGLSTATNAVITASDSVLSALGKLQKQISDNLTTLTSHTGNTSNPHSVTKTQIGLGNVDNTSDINKPVSTAQAAADAAVLASANATTAAHAARTDNPHTVTAAQLGLGNVENKSSATIRSEITSGNVTTALGYTPENAAQKGTAGGYAPLDGTGKVASTYLPSTDAVPEGASNLYFTAARVLATVLSGLSTATNAVITAADTVLSALGKLQKQISDNLTTLTSHTSNTSNPHNATAAQVGAAASGAVTTSGLTMSTARLLGRTTATTGAVEEITPGANLSLAAGSLSVTPSGTSKQIQYNNAGTLGGVPQLEFDAATNELRLGVGLTYNNNTGTLTLRQKAGGVANLLEVLNSSGTLTMSVNQDGGHLAPSFIDPVLSLRAISYIENPGRYIDSALNGSTGSAGDVLIISTASDSTTKKAAVTDREKIPVGVGTAFNAPSWVSYRGNETVNADSGAISIGDRLVMSATTGGLVCADTTNNIALATVGYALTAKAGGSPGTITAWIHPTPGYKTLTVESLTTVGVVKQTVYTVATLPSASTSGNGARSHVSDALAPTFGATVAAGGSVSTPVYSDGTNWKVG